VSRRRDGDERRYRLLMRFTVKEIALQVRFPAQSTRTHSEQADGKASRESGCARRARERPPNEGFNRAADERSMGYGPLPLKPRVAVLERPRYSERSTLALPS
jgi:hypothetical protein